MKAASPDSIWRRIVAASCLVLLAASCGGGSDRDGRASAQASDPEAAGVAPAAVRGRRESGRCGRGRAGGHPGDGLRGGAGPVRLRQSHPPGRRIRRQRQRRRHVSGRRHRRGRRRQVHDQPRTGLARDIGILFGARVTPFRQGFDGMSQVVGGTGFAMGGSRVSQQPGIGCDPDPATGACRQALTIPVDPADQRLPRRQRRSLQSPPDGVRVRRGERCLLPARRVRGPDE